VRGGGQVAVEVAEEALDMTARIAVRANRDGTPGGLARSECRFYQAHLADGDEDGRLALSASDASRRRTLVIDSRRRSSSAAFLKP